MSALAARLYRPSSGEALRALLRIRAATRLWLRFPLFFGHAAPSARPSDLASGMIDRGRRTVEEVKLSMVLLPPAWSDEDDPEDTVVMSRRSK